MVARRIVVSTALPHVPTALDALRAELQLPTQFPPAVLADAGAALARGPRGRHVDRTDLEFVTIDPPGSRDLDQAMALARTPAGFVVHYAIADVGSWIDPGSALDVEAWSRGETVYLPDGRVPLYPPELSEAAASLLPDGPRPAVLWTLTLDADGQLQSTMVERALVRSRAHLDYPTVQAAYDAGTADEWVSVLADIGRLRIAAQRSRGGADMRVPEQHVSLGADGVPTLSYRVPSPLEDWNAHISQLTGIAAAQLMLDAGIGLLRTLPDPDTRTVEQFRRTATALGVAWPNASRYGDILASLDPAQPRAAALLNQAPPLFRGAAYTAFDGTVPALTTHAGIGAAYAHATAPLRRLADRYVLDLCVALCAGAEPPAHVRAALPLLPAAMAASGRRANAVDKAVVDLVEATLLSESVGADFDAVVVDADDHSAVVQLADPAVRTRIPSPLALGAEVRLRVTAADPAARTVTLVPVDR